MTDPLADSLQHPIPEDVKFWLTRLIGELAFQHDVGGPAIVNVSESRYKEKVITITRKRMMAAQLAGEIQFALEDLDIICALAANELFRIRSVRNAHAKGTLSTEELRTLPVHSGYPDYFEQTYESQIAGFIELRRQLTAGHYPADAPAPASPSATVAGKSGSFDEPVSARTREWMDVYVLSLILAIEMAGVAGAGTASNDLVQRWAAECRRDVERAIRIGDLDIAMGAIDAICEKAAREAFTSVQLKRSRSMGGIRRRKLRRHPLYEKYREYFEDEPALLRTFAGAMVVNAAVAQERAAEGN